MRYLRHAALGAVLALGLVGAAHADEAAVVAVIQDRAAAHGVSASTITALFRCEATLRPDAVGDHGHSHGLAQLNDTAIGLLAHFHAQGYGSAYDTWSASDYVARVLSGEWASEGVTIRRWTCGR